MYNEEEKKFIELNNRFKAELDDLEKQMEALEKRHDVLHTLLFGDPVVEEEPVVVNSKSLDNPDPQGTDSELVTFLANNPDSKRKDIDAGLKGKGHTRYAVDKSLKRLKAQGLIVNEGSTQRTRWYTAKEAD